MAWSKQELSKTVKVSDPWNWYDEDEIQIRLFCLLPHDGWENASTIRVLADSADDFMMCIDIACQRDSEVCVKYTYDFAKKYIFDTIPDEVSVDWLLEHGFYYF